ncbi:MAG: hypothetical protein U0Y10_07470 [Spirosomataceae bacterium]
MNKWTLLGVGMALLVSAAGCKDENTGPSFDIGLQETTLGKVLADGTGKTLYFFTKDVTGTSQCTGGCLDNWPLFYNESLRLDVGLNASDFGTITRSDGKKQTTYKGWPLYTYKNDAATGDVKGENVAGIWSVAKISYTIMLANTQLVGHDGKNYNAQYKEGVADTQYFVDEQGRTLYAYIKDKKNKNNFTKSDFSNNSVWPIFEVELKDVPSTLDKSQFSTIKVGDKNQLTYKGWPLYYFGQDNSQRGITKGVSFPSPGVWPIIQKETTPAPES